MFVESEGSCRWLDQRVCVEVAWPTMMAGTTLRLTMQVPISPVKLSPLTIIQKVDVGHLIA